MTMWRAFYMLIYYAFISKRLLSEATRPTLLWPLDYNTYTTEVMVSPTSPVNQSYCILSFQPMPAGFPYASVYLSGTSYIDVRVSASSTTGKEFAFSGVFLLSSNSATLFHYRPDDASTLKDIMIWFSGGSIAMKRKTSLTEQTSTVTVAFQIDTWFYASVGIDVNHGFLYVQFNTNTVINYNVGSNTDIILPGTLRIGATFDNNESSLIGRVTCVGFHVGLYIPDESISTDECKCPSWTRNVPSCAISSTQTTSNSPTQSTSNATTSTTSFAPTQVTSIVSIQTTSNAATSTTNYASESTTIYASTPTSYATNPTTSYNQTRSKNKTIGHFERSTGMYLSTLNPIYTTRSSSNIGCAVECFTHTLCSYFKAINTGNTLLDCLMYDSTVAKLVGNESPDLLLFEWKE